MMKGRNRFSVQFKDCTTSVVERIKGQKETLIVNVPPNPRLLHNRFTTGLRGWGNLSLSRGVRIKGEEEINEQTPDLQKHGDLTYATSGLGVPLPQTSIPETFHYSKSTPILPLRRYYSYSSLYALSREKRYTFVLSFRRQTFSPPLGRTLSQYTHGS